MAERAAPELQGNEQRRWLDLLELEHDNMRAALECAIDDKRVDDATRMVFALWRFWQSRGYLREGLAWAERGLALAPGDERLRLRALESAGGLTYWMADMTATERYYREAYDRAAELGDATERAKGAYNLSFVYMLSAGERHEAAKALLEEALDVYRSTGDRANIGRAAWALGQVYGEGPDRTHADFLKAKQLAHEALEQHRALGNRFDIAWDLHSTGLAALKLGELHEAKEDWREALEYFVQAADSSGIVLLLSDLSELASARGDRERQATLVGAWTALSRRTGVGLASLWGATEGRMIAETVPDDLRPAFERGLTLKTEEAIAHALASQPAKTA
jgi:tetratricopeptide (TPR) repeat protein